MSYKPDVREWHEYIYLTGELEGPDFPHWCEDRISDDDIQYRRTDVTNAEITALKAVMLDVAERIYDIRATMNSADYITAFRALNKEANKLREAVK